MKNNRPLPSGPRPRACRVQAFGVFSPFLRSTPEFAPLSFPLLVFSYRQPRGERRGPWQVFIGRFPPTSIPQVMAETIDLSGDGGVLKTVVRKAKDDAIAPSDSLPLVDVHYEGTLADNGEVFDTTHEDNSVFSFEIGQGAVIKAWDIALRTMKVGEVAKITCKPEYAYGTVGSPPEIHPNATLIFEVELVACRPRKGSSVGSVSDEKARLEELKKQRELAAATKEEEKRKREEAKAAAAARVQAKLDAKKGKGKGKGK